MATAAMLEVKVLADTHSATSSLNTFDRKLNAIDKSSATATTRTTSLGKATRTAGSHLRSAAGYAAGAAAAYLSIAQAKAAVTTTQDLAKTTAGLNRNLGFTVKTGSQWAAVAKSRDIDAKSLTMSFTTLSRRVVDASTAIKGGADATDAAVAPFARLGISQNEIVKGSQNLAGFMPKLADAFGNAAGGAERQASAQQLLGRGYSTVLPLFADGAKGLKEQQMWADKYGATLTNVTLKAQMKEVQAQRESKVAWLGLQVAFTKFVTPALEVANKQFQKITALLNDPKLTNAEKFKQIGDIIGGWASKALDAFVAILPSIISKAGEAAPKIAGALVQGFMDAPVWGKLVLGSFLLSKLGGLAAAGARLGTVFGTAFAGKAAPLVLAAASPAILAKIGTDELRSHIVPVTEAIRDQFGITQKAAEKVVVYMQAHPGLGAPESLALMRRAAKIANQDWTDAWHSIVRVANKGGQDVDDNAQEAFSNFAFILDKQAMKGTEAVSAAMGKIIAKSAEMKRGVSANVLGLADAVTVGLRTIGENTNKALKAFGVKPLAFDIGAAVGAGSRDAQHHQTGGLIVGGTGSGDKVPAMLEPGEVVINRKAVAAAGGAGKVNAINKAIPRFATGGTVPGDVGGLHPGILGLVSSLYSKYGGSVSSGLRASDSGSLHSTGQAADYVPSNWAGASAAVNAVGSKLLEGIYNPANLGGTAVSWDTGAHVPSSFWGSEWGNHLDHIHLAIADGVTAAAGKMARDIKRVMLSGPDGPLKSLGQAALDKVRNAANKFIASKAPTGLTGDMSAISSGAYKGPLDKVFPHPTTVGNPGIALSASQVSGLAGKAGLARGLFTQIAQGESGFHPGIVGYDPGGTRGLGLWQITTGFNDDIIKRFGGESQMFNPWVNAQAAKAIFDRQGQGAWVGYQKGGIAPYAGKFHDGGVVGGEAWARVTKGETIRTPGQESALNKAVMLLARGGVAHKYHGPWAGVHGGGHRGGGGGNYHGPWASLVSNATWDPYNATWVQTTPPTPSNSVTVHGEDEAMLEALAANAQALADLQVSIDAQNALIGAVGSSDGYQALQAIADLMSGQLGGRIAAVSHTAGAIGSASRS